MAVLREAAQALPDSCRIVVAYSGGRDSTALLAALHALWPERMRALHVHHGLHPDADAWAAHCAAFCSARAIEFAQCRVTVAEHHGGPEAGARAARYAALQSAMAPGELLVMAHHADDQAETVLFRLLRGGGARLGMRPLRRLRGERVESWLWRPLLGVSRAELTNYCRRHALDYIDDPGNSDARSNARANTRARLRALMPELEAVVPGAAAALRQQAVRQEDASALGAVQMGPELAARMHDGALDVRGIAAWSAPRRRALLRAWLGLLGLPLPGPDWLAHCETDVLGAAEDRQPEMALGGDWLRRFNGRLWVLRTLGKVPEQWEQTWDGGDWLTLPAEAGSLQCFDGPVPELVVRFARPADRLRLRDNGPHRRLKAHFQAARVPPWERLRTPLISSHGETLQLGNQRLPAAAVRLAQARIVWHPGCWHRRPEGG